MLFVFTDLNKSFGGVETQSESVEDEAGLGSKLDEDG